jgi:hypothetical protein
MFASLAGDDVSCTYPTFLDKGLALIFTPTRIGPGGELEGVPEEPTSCERVTAMLTVESTSYGTSTKDGTVTTTASKTLSNEFPLVGCAAKDTATATTTKACNAQPTARALGLSAGEDNENTVDEDGERLAARAPPCEPDFVDAVFFPYNHYDVSQLRARLISEQTAADGPKLESINEIRADRAGFTAFFYVKNYQRVPFLQTMRDKDNFGVLVIASIAQCRC